MKAMPNTASYLAAPEGVAGGAQERAAVVGADHQVPENAGRQHGGAASWRR